MCPTTTISEAFDTRRASPFTGERGITSRYPKRIGRRVITLEVSGANSDTDLVQLDTRRSESRLRTPRRHVPGPIASTLDPTARQVSGVSVTSVWRLSSVALNTLWMLSCGSVSAAGMAGVVDTAPFEDASATVVVVSGTVDVDVLDVVDVVEVVAEMPITVGTVVVVDVVLVVEVVVVDVVVVDVVVDDAGTVVEVVVVGVVDSSVNRNIEVPDAFVAVIV